MLIAIQATAPGCIGVAESSSGYRLDFADGTSRPATPAEILAAAQAQMVERIKAERDRRKFEGVPVGPHRFHSDPDSRTQQLGLVILGANIPAGLQWKTLGGAFVTMTQTLAMQIFGATAARDTAIFAKAEAHIAAVEALQDAEAVLAYDFTTGWPA